MAPFTRLGIVPTGALTPGGCLQTRHSLALFMFAFAFLPLVLIAYALLTLVANMKVRVKMLDELSPLSGAF